MSGSHIPKQVVLLAPGQMRVYVCIQLGICIMSSEGWMIQPWAAPDSLPDLAPGGI